MHPRGLDGARHWLGERWRCPAGGLPSWSPVRPCRRGSRRGACRLCRLPILPLACFLAPIPPPALAERSSRREGGDFLFSYARGFAPCIPGAEPGRHRSRGAYHALAGDLPGWSPADLAVPESAGVACLACRLPPLPLALILPPSPPTPFPAGRGRFLVFLCKGLRPLHPRS